jgi:hypothetical protein
VATVDLDAEATNVEADDDATADTEVAIDAAIDSRRKADDVDDVTVDEATAESTKREDTAEMMEKVNRDDDATTDTDVAIDEANDPRRNADDVHDATEDDTTDP